MIPKVCNLCELTGIEKLVSLYWAWNNADGRRRAWKQKVCPDCFRSYYAPAIVRALEPLLLCPVCGEGTADDYDAVYLTYCVPGMPKDQSEMPCCGSCAVRIRSDALKGAVELEDRGVGVGGPQPPPLSAEDAWAALGLPPRGR